MKLYHDLIRDLHGEGHRRFHPRVFETTGPVVDIGCLGWDWCKPFANKKEVIGYDPLEQNQPKWATLIQEVVVPREQSETVPIYENQLASSTWGGGSLKHCYTSSMSDVLAHEPALIKINIEGDEYALLHAQPHPWCDQLVVAFHDWLHPRWHCLSHAFVSWLSQWYYPIQTDAHWTWWLFLRR